ncbi:SEC-C metal-binding domain-containing protein [Psychrobacter cibarius]|uniref:SEC-C metal-binding domain-containing protein n=1 Tax=Psychrobacter cibarius TaxID=282669 RepID=UPI003FD5AAEF
MEFDDFDFDLSVLDDDQTSTKNSSEDTAKLKLLKQLLSSNHTDFDDKLAELQLLLYGELLVILGEYDAHNIRQHHKLIKRTLFEFVTAMQTPTFAVISDDILSAYHEFSANDAKNILTHLGVGKHLGTDQNEDFYSLFSKLVCYVGQSDSCQVNIVNRNGHATDISSVDSKTLYSLFNDQKQGASSLHQLFTLQIGVPQWPYKSAVIKLIPMALSDIASAAHTVSTKQVIETLSQCSSTQSDSTPNHPSILMKATISRLQAQVTQTQNECRQDINLLTKSLLNDDNLSDAASKALNTIVNTKKQQLTKLQNLSTALAPFKSKLSAAVNQLIKIVQLPKAKRSLPNDMLWLSLSMGTNNIDELLDQVIGRFVDNYSCEDFDSISSMAEQGHARAQYSLGSCYHFAQGVEEDQSRAVEWYRKAAEQGYIDAQYNLGFCYQFSYGMEQDLSQAVVWYKKAAEQGHASAQAYLGLLYENGIGVAEDIKEAVVWYKKSAEQGHLDAQCYLGNCYFCGNGIEEDEVIAFEWYKESAEQGNIDAQNNLGICYEHGYGTGGDSKKAVAWYRKAAEQGHSGAQCNLGLCYQFSYGVEENYSLAVKWYRKATEQGNSDAQFHLGNCYLYGQGISKNEFRAIEYFQRAAEQGHADAQFRLANCYQLGQGVKKNINKSVEWYRKAAEQGHTDAQSALDNRYPSEVNNKRNDNKIIEWYLKDAEQGDSAAQFHVGDCYFNGNGIEKNYKLAVRWYQKSAEQGNAEAQYSLGNCYQFSYGIKNDQAKAAEWYRKAAEQGHAGAQSALDDCQPSDDKSYTDTQVSRNSSCSCGSGLKYKYCHGKI